MRGYDAGKIEDLVGQIVRPMQAGSAFSTPSPSPRAPTRKPSQKLCVMRLQ